MKRFIFAALVSMTLAALLIPVSANAATGAASLAWSPPTTYTNGTPLAASSISANVIDCVLTPVGGIAAPCGVVPPQVAGNSATASVTFTYPSQGARACFRVRALVGNTSSAPSNELCKDFAPLTPSAPTNLTVTVTVSVVVAP